MTLPWPDRLALKLVSYIPGQVSEQNPCHSCVHALSLHTHGLLNMFLKLSFSPQDPFRRNLRRTVMRYVNVSIILVFRLVSHKAS